MGYPDEEVLCVVCRASWLECQCVFDNAGTENALQQADPLNLIPAQGESGELGEAEEPKEMESSQTGRNNK